MMRFIIAFLLLSLNTVAWSNIYKSQDEDGNVSFSDIKSPGAVEIKAVDAQTYTPVTIPNTIRPNHSKQATSRRKTSDITKISPYYTKISIVTPKQDSTLPNRSGDVDVLLNTTPQLKANDIIQLSMDDHIVKTAKGQMRFKIDNAFRGKHTLSATILDPKGRHLIQSETMTFYVQRPSKLFGPLHKTPPAPKSSLSPAKSLTEIIKKLAPLATLLVA